MKKFYQPGVEKVNKSQTADIELIVRAFSNYAQFINTLLTILVIPLRA
jgi:hypothetical protein